MEEKENDLPSDSKKNVIEELKIRKLDVDGSNNTEKGTVEYIYTSEGIVKKELSESKATVIPEYSPKTEKEELKQSDHEGVKNRY